MKSVKLGGEEEEAPTQEAQDQVVRYLVNQSTNMIRVFYVFLYRPGLLNALG